MQPSYFNQIVGYLECSGRRIFGISFERFGGRVETVGQPAANIGCLNENRFAFPRIARILTHLRQRVPSILYAANHLNADY